MSDLSCLNDQQNLTLTQISYCSNMLSKHHGKTFAEIFEFISSKHSNQRSGEEDEFLKLMNQFPNDNNPYANYIVQATANNQSSGFGAVAFIDDNGNTGISYRGTDGAPSKKSINDWLDNLISGVTGDSPQCREAEDFFERYSNSNGNNYVFGHSKGGNLAEYVYAKNFEKIKGMHLLNPQPLNPWTLNKEQLKALQLDKVDIVIIEGDYVWFIGKLPSYRNVRIADSIGENSHSYWSLSFNNGSISKGNQPWWEFVVYYEVLKISPLIQGGGAIFDFFCDCVHTFVDYVKFGLDKCKEFAAWMCDKLKAIGENFYGFVLDIGEFFNKLVHKMEMWFNQHFNASYNCAMTNPQVVVNTYKLDIYAQRLGKVNNRISNLDRRLDALYWKVGLLGLWNLMQADLLVGYSWRLSRCASYLSDTAIDFNSVENELINNV